MCAYLYVWFRENVRTQRVCMVHRERVYVCGGGEARGGVHACVCVCVREREGGGEAGRTSDIE